LVSSSNLKCTHTNMHSQSWAKGTEREGERGRERGRGRGAEFRERSLHSLDSDLVLKPRPNSIQPRRVCVCFCVCECVCVCVCVCLGVVQITSSPLACGIISGKYDSGVPPYSRASLKVHPACVAVATHMRFTVRYLSFWVSPLSFTFSFSLFLPSPLCSSLSLSFILLSLFASLSLSLSLCLCLSVSLPFLISLHAFSLSSLSHLL